jgi:hypothetical protein
VQKTKVELSCQALLTGLGIYGSKPLANLLMAMSSYCDAHSATDYTSSPLYHYQFSSFGKLFSTLVSELTDSAGAFDPSGLDKAIISYMMEQNACLFPNAGVIRTHLDVSPVHKPHSKCLASRSYVYSPNETISGNKPVEIGFGLSFLNIGVENWSLPVSILRSKPTETYNEVGVSQLRAFAQLLAHKSVLVVNSADSSYGCASFLCPAHAETNVVNIVRLKGRNVYQSCPTTKTGGANGVYGACFRLQREAEVSQRKNPQTKELAVPKPSIFTLAPDRIERYETVTKQKKKPITVELRLYKEMKIRSKCGRNMKDKPFDLVVVSHYDTKAGVLYHQNPLYLAVCGEKKQEVDLRAVYEEHYLHRYDIEPNNRFVKQQLQLDKFQTPILEHFDLWLRLIQLTESLLFQASDAVVSQPKKWQKYADKLPSQRGRLTIAQTRKACQSLFLTFDQTPFLPQVSNKGKGREKGTTFTPKPTCPPIKKTKKDRKKTNKAPAEPAEIKSPASK